MLTRYELSLARYQLPRNVDPVTKSGSHSLHRLWWRNWALVGRQGTDPFPGTGHQRGSNRFSTQRAKDEVKRYEGRSKKSGPSDFLLDNIFAWAKNVTAKLFCLCKSLQCFTSFTFPIFSAFLFLLHHPHLSLNNKNLFSFFHRQYRVFLLISRWWKI